MRQGGISVLVVDDHPPIVAALKRWTKGVDDIEIEGSASGIDEAIRFVSASKIDVVLLDLIFPSARGIDAIGPILRTDPRVKILLYTGTQRSDEIVAGLLAGAHGHVDKLAGEDILLSAIRNVASGGFVISSDLSRAMRDAAANDKTSIALGLTRRELQTLMLLAHGHSNERIAQQLGVRIKTVNDHVSRVLKKLGLANRTQAAIYALKHGLVRLDEIDL